MKTIALCLLLFCAPAFASEPALPDFSRYEPTDTFQTAVRLPVWMLDANAVYQRAEALEDTVRSHTYGRFSCFSVTDAFPPDDHYRAPEWPRDNTLLFAATVFYRNGPRVVLRYGVNPKGFKADCRDCYNWAIQDLQSKWLSARKLANLKKALAALPKENAYPPMPQLAIVSWREGADWITRTMPAAALKPVLGIIGERFETRPKNGLFDDHHLLPGLPMCGTFADYHEPGR